MTRDSRLRARVDRGRRARPSRHGSYGAQTLLNLDAIGFAGAVWGVNPGRAEVLGRPCVPIDRAICPTPVDAVVVAIPAAGVRGRRRAGRRARVRRRGRVQRRVRRDRGGRELQGGWSPTARRHGLPVCGPNCNGIVAMQSRVALWGDALRPARGRARRARLPERQRRRQRAGVAARAALPHGRRVAATRRCCRPPTTSTHLAARGRRRARSRSTSRTTAAPRAVRWRSRPAPSAASRGRRAEGRQLARRRRAAGRAQRRARRRPAGLPRAGRGSRRGLGRGRARAARAGEGTRGDAHDLRARRRAGDPDLLRRRLAPGRRRGHARSGWRCRRSRRRPVRGSRSCSRRRRRSRTRSTTRR